MNGTFTLDGVSSNTWGAFIVDSQIDNGVPRRINAKEIPGRIGSLLLQEKTLPDIEIVYSGIIYQNFETNYSAMKNFLLSRSGYVRLSDSFHPDEFYKAYYDKELEATVSRERTMGKFKLSFVRQGARYLTSGETPVEFTADGSITNPTYFSSRPLIRVYGTGELGIGSSTVTITTADGWTDIDCEMMDAHKDLTPCNSNIILSGYDFPTLVPGANGITLGTGITRVIITPRWWRV